MELLDDIHASADLPVVKPKHEMSEREYHPRQAFAMVLAPEFDTTDETVSDPLGLLTGTDLKWFRNQGLIFRLKNL